MKILCACGCGTEIDAYDRYGRSRKFVRGHNRTGMGMGWRTSNGISKRYHDYTAERALGKSLPNKAVVHHHNNTQLVICQDQAYHLLIHQRTRAYKNCGHANWLKCGYCGKYDDPKNLYLRSGYRGGHHSECNIKYCGRRRNIKPDQQKVAELIELLSGTK